MNNDPIAKLRAYIDNHLYDYDVSSALWVDISEILDEIEEQYMKLPVGADNMPIRPGQTLYKDNSVIPGKSVYAVGDNHVYIWNFNNSKQVFGYYADTFTHEKPDTLEGIIMEAMQSTFSGDKVADYVERIRKAVENG